WSSCAPEWAVEQIEILVPRKQEQQQRAKSSWLILCVMLCAGQRDLRFCGRPIDSGFQEITVAPLNCELLLMTTLERAQGWAWKSQRQDVHSLLEAVSDSIQEDPLFAPTSTPVGHPGLMALQPSVSAALADSIAILGCFPRNRLVFAP